MSQLYFYFDQSRCTACNCCAVSCKDWNDVKPGVQNFRKVLTHEEGSFSKGTTTVYNLVFSCNHCENPACIEACPAEAISKRADDGVVLVDYELCGGVGECVKACPYSAIHLEDRNDGRGEQAYKCTLCWDRLAEGKIPSCVGSCPQRALDVDTLENLKLKHPDLVKDVSKAKGMKNFPKDNIGSDGRKLAKGTNPSIVFRLK